jgi:hypothetical protein
VSRYYPHVSFPASGPSISARDPSRRGKPQKACSRQASYNEKGVWSRR